MQRRPYVTAQAGFTLLEAAIVLGVIGVLIGSALWGRELATQARTRSLIIDLNGLAAAVTSYQDRYHALPGDDPQAQGRWGLTAVPAAAPSTPGNRSVDGAYNQPPSVPEPESRLFWWHLRQAGFVPGPTDPANAALAAQQPTNVVGGMTGVTMGTGPATVGLAGLILCTANIPDKIAVAVDMRLDDGAPADGEVRARRQTAVNEDLGPAATGYVEDGGSYLLCRKL